MNNQGSSWHPPTGTATSSSIFKTASECRSIHGYMESKISIQRARNGLRCQHLAWIWTLSHRSTRRNQPAPDRCQITSDLTTLVGIYWMQFDNDSAIRRNTFRHPLRGLALDSTTAFCKTELENAQLVSLKSVLLCQSHMDSNQVNAKNSPWAMKCSDFAPVNNSPCSIWIMLRLWRMAYRSSISVPRDSTYTSR